MGNDNTQMSSIRTQKNNNRVHDNDHIGQLKVWCSNG